MTRARPFVLLLALLALGGCWTGDQFYAPSDIRAAIPAGDYRMSGPTTDGTGHVRVALRPDGLTLITPVSEDGAPDPGDATILGFAPLDAQGTNFAAWLTAIDDRSLAGDVVPYALLRRLEGGAFSLVVPGCEDNEEIARAAGAQISTGSLNPSCSFPDRASLETALRALAARGDEGISMVPLSRQ